MIEQTRRSISESPVDIGPIDRVVCARAIEKYRQPSLPRALWQIANTVVPYTLLWYLMYACLAVSWWLVAPLALVAGALLVRIFIIFHDCGHGSYFLSRRMNNIFGFAAGVLTFTPYYHWRWQHAIHHGSVGDLDKRGTGDVWTLTVQEYQESSRRKRVAYHLVRNPVVLFVLAPLFLFVVAQRYPSPRANARERNSVWWTNLAILGLAIGLSHFLGVAAYLLIQLQVLMVSGAIGVWMFYMQHQFEDTYWERSDNWNYAAAALQGSSFYRLPKVLQWFSGNIGFHHVHHLSSRIPNYNLQKCHEAEPMLQCIKPLTLLGSLESLRLRLWDEKSRKLVDYGRARQIWQEQQEHHGPGEPGVRDSHC